MRGTAFAASIVSLAAGASAAPLFLDAAALRSEVAVRRAVYGEAPTGTWAAQARALDRVLQALDTSSPSLGEDLQAMATTARFLERSFGDDRLLSMRIGEILDEGEAIVAGTLVNASSAVEAAPWGRPSRRAMAALDGAQRLLERSRAAGSLEARARLLQLAFARVEAARAALGSGPARAEVSATVAIGGIYLPVPPPTEFLAVDGGALVTVDGDGVPTGLLLRFRRAAPGGPASASLEIRLDAGFSGTGTWPMPSATYDHEGRGSGSFWTLGAGAGSLPTNALSVTEFDPVEGRIAGTFLLGASTNQYRLSLAMTGGTFEVTGVLFRGP